MEKLKQKAEILAETAAQQARAEVKTALVAELDSSLSVTETSEGVTVSGQGLHREMAGHSGLRDVAFLLRGMR
ncbi:hypothetical protein AB1K62_11165 [Parasphingorhabdus sp. JC815]|uniref:hypothetical protein n=1 Tax=Parasphingorhabdus sp. JC815 TaxID=3232140 RepID=UPI0034592CE3